MRNFLWSLFALLTWSLASAQCTNPTVPVLNANDTAICEYDLVILTASGNLNDADGWYWYSSSCGGTLEWVGNWIAVTPSVTTVYYVRGEGGGCVTPGACASVTVTINSNPVINTSREVDTPSDCGASNGSITGITASGNGPFQYSWDGNSYAASSALSGAPAGSHYLQVRDVNGCTSTDLFTVYNPPPAVINNSALSITKPTCGQFNGTITGITATGSPTLTYSWDNGSTYTTSSSLTSVDAGIYHLTVKDGHNCTVTQSYTISGTTSPAATPTISGVPSQICQGSNLMLSIANPPAGNLYEWTTSTGLTGSGNSFNITSVSSSGSNACSVFVLVTDNSGCQNSKSISFTVNPLPALNVSPLAASGCLPICVAFSNSGSSSGTCSWSFGDGATDFGCAPAHCYNLPGTYYAVLQMIDANGCTNRDSAAINAYPIPSASFSASPQPTTLSSPTVNFTDLSGSALIASWNWDFGTTPSNTSTLQNPSFTYQDTGTYYVKLFVVSSYGCIDSIVKPVRIDPMVGIDLTSSMPLEIYPNPAKNSIQIKSKTPIGQVTILNTLGGIVLRTHISKAEETIDLSGMPPGIYLLEQNGKSKKFVKE